MQEKKIIACIDNIDIVFKIKNNIIYIRSYDMFNLLYYFKGENFLINHNRIIKEEVDKLKNIENIVELEHDSLKFFKDVYISLNSFIKNLEILEIKEKNNIYINILKILLEYIDNYEIKLNYECKENNSKLNVDINLM